MKNSALWVGLSLLLLCVKISLFFYKKNDKRKLEMRNELDEIWKEDDATTKLSRLNALINRLNQ